VGGIAESVVHDYRFDRWVLALTDRLSRRGLGRLTAGLLGALGLARGAPADAALKKKKKKHKKKPKKRRKSAPSSPPALCPREENCAGRECGSDGCGGSCGACADDLICSTPGRCVCTPRCQGRQCGVDGCGGSCGNCPAAAQCDAPTGQCVCDPPCPVNTTCVLGVCQCPHATCHGVCCDTGQVCDAANACCAPEPREITCQGRCGPVPNTCDESIDCGACGYAFVRAWGTARRGKPGELHLPRGVAVDGAGTVYVADTANHRIQTFASDGDVLAVWGSFGTGARQFSAPGGIAVDTAGNLFIADTGNHRVQKLDPNGAFIAQWGGLGAAEGRFNAPRGIAIDSAGNVYVADSNNGRIQKLASGAVNFATLLEGFEQPTAVAVDAAGNIHITETAENRIRMYDRDLHALDHWLSSAIHLGGPAGIAIDGADNVYVVNQFDQDVRAFRLSTANPPRYEQIAVWGGAGSAVGQFAVPRGIAVNGAGAPLVAVADTENHRIQTFSAAGVPRHQWGASAGNDEFGQLAGLAVDATDTVYSTDAAENRVQVFTSDGDVITTWGSSGTGEGQFNAPYGIAAGAGNAIFVVETHSNRVQRFSSGGVFQERWGSQSGGSGAREFLNPTGIAVRAGFVYVVDGGNHRIQKLTQDGVFQDDWRAPDDVGLFEIARGIAVDDAGFVYLADSGNHRILKFTTDGAFVARWGRAGGLRGTGNGAFDSPEGVAVDNAGKIFVADSGNHRIQVFASDGSFLGAWGRQGSGDGEFRFPIGVAVNSGGAIYVADRDNHRIQAFALDAASRLTPGKSGRNAPRHSSRKAEHKRRRDPVGTDAGEHRRSRKAPRHAGPRRGRKRTRKHQHQRNRDTTRDQ
jgi:DNA-binding beta-propeller fold protein YncE